MLIRQTVSEATWPVYSRVWEECFGLVHGLCGAVVEGYDGLLVLYFIGRNVGEYRCWC